MFVRLTQTRFCDCCSSGSLAVVADYEKHINFCIQCWGEKLHRENPDIVKRIYSVVL